MLNQRIVLKTSIKFPPESRKTLIDFGLEKSIHALEKCVSVAIDTEKHDGPKIKDVAASILVLQKAATEVNEQLRSLESLFFSPEETGIGVVVPPPTYDESGNDDLIKRIDVLIHWCQSIADSLPKPKQGGQFTVQWSIAERVALECEKAGIKLTVTIPVESIRSGKSVWSGKFERVLQICLEEFGWSEDKIETKVHHLTADYVEYRKTRYDRNFPSSVERENTIVKPSRS